MPKIVNRGPAGLLSKDSKKLVNRGAAGLLSKKDAKAKTKEQTPAGLSSPSDAAAEAIQKVLREGKKDHFLPELAKLTVPIDKPIPDPNNARLHPERNMEAIMLSLARYGQRTPLVINRKTGHVLKGNGTLQAAKNLGWTKIAAVWCDDDDATAAGYGLADNRSAEHARWDFEVVARLQRLIEESRGGNTDMVGWTKEEITALRMQGRAHSNPDAIPEPPKTPVSKRGDLWTMGEHRLLCGDSVDKKDAARLMEGVRGTLMATDPPYGVSFGTNNYCATAKDWGQIQGDTLSGDKLKEWITLVLKTWFPFMLRSAAFYVWCASLEEGHRVYEGIKAAGLHIQSQVVWVKNHFALGQADYQWCHEPAWYAFFKGEKHRWYGGRDKRTTWLVDKIGNANYLHPTQKPVELFLMPINHHTTPGDLVVEPFAGSGTQFIAAQQAGRRCYGMDIDPVYCDVVLRRWVDFTGLDPVREDGKKFSELVRG